MKVFRKLIFVLIAVVGLSISASAQKGDKPRPPKEKPPVINPGDKKPPKGNPPKNDDKKKPEMSWLFVSNRYKNDTA